MGYPPVTLGGAGTDNETCRHCHPPVARGQRRRASVAASEGRARWTRPARPQPTRCDAAGSTPGDVKLAVIQRGDPAHPTVVLVHGYPDTQAVWDELAELLADRFHVVSLRRPRRRRVHRARQHRGLRLPAAHRRPRGGHQGGEPGPAGAPGRSRLGLAAVLGGGQHAPAGRPGGLVHLDVRALARPGHGLAAPPRAARPARAPPTWPTSSARSWYIGFFQLPGLPELAWRGGLGRRWGKMLAAGGHHPPARSPGRHHHPGRDERHLAVPGEHDAPDDPAAARPRSTSRSR